MRKLTLLAVMAVMVVTLAGLATAALPAHAQDIIGLSLRPTDKFAGTSGTVDITADKSGTKYQVKVDLSKGADKLKLDQFKDAKALVVWVVDMDGVRHNVGTLSDKGVLDGGTIDGVVAKVFVTPEADKKAESPTGDRIYEVVLRNVDEKTAPPAAEAKTAAAASTGSTAPEPAKAAVASSGTTGKPAAAAAAPAGGSTASTAAKPSVLPTTGNAMSDLLVLVVVAAALLVGGMQLRRVRV